MNDKFIIFTASDGFEAGHQVTKLKPDLVLLDIKLPGIDGFKVCKLIKKYDSNIKIIAITGHPSEKIRKKILQSGAHYYLKKPIGFEDLSPIFKKIFKIKIIQPTK